MSYEFTVERSLATRGYNLWISSFNDRSQEYSVAKPFVLEFDVVKNGDPIHPEPTLKLPEIDAIQMIGALVKGLNANQFIKEKFMKDEEKKAIENHLESMKNMVDKLFILANK